MKPRSLAREPLAHRSQTYECGGRNLGQPGQSELFQKLVVLFRRRLDRFLKRHQSGIRYR